MQNKTFKILVKHDLFTFTKGQIVYVMNNDGTSTIFNEEQFKKLSETIEEIATSIHNDKELIEEKVSDAIFQSFEMILPIQKYNNLLETGFLMVMEELYKDEDKPEMLAEIDQDSIKKICQDYIDFVASEEYHEDNDWKNYIYETVMQAVFGEDVFKYINSK